MPTLSEVHVDQALTDFTVAFLQDAGAYVGQSVTGSTPTGQQSNRYHVYTKEDFLRTDARKRGPNTSSAGRDYRLSTNTYFCDVWAIHYDVSEQESANADAAIESETDAARLLAQDIAIRDEMEFATLAFTGANWSNSVTGGTNFTRFSDAASTPIETLRTGGNTVLQDTGKMANTLVLGHATWAGDTSGNSGLVDHPDILDRIKHTQRGVITEDLVAGILEMEQVAVSRAVRNTAAEGVTESDSFILGDDALVCHIDRGAGLRGATAIKRFVWSGLTGSVDGTRTKRYDIPQEDAYPRIEVDTAFDYQVVSAALGYHLDDCV